MLVSTISITTIIAIIVLTSAARVRPHPTTTSLGRPRLTDADVDLAIADGLLCLRVVGGLEVPQAKSQSSTLLPDRSRDIEDHEWATCPTKSWLGPEWLYYLTNVASAPGGRFDGLRAVGLASTTTDREQAAHEPARSAPPLMP